MAEANEKYLRKQFCYINNLKFYIYINIIDISVVFEGVGREG